MTPAMSSGSQTEMPTGAWYVSRLSPIDFSIVCAMSTVRVLDHDKAGIAANMGESMPCRTSIGDFHFHFGSLLTMRKPII
jgi:hypothetical protein